MTLVNTTKFNLFAILITSVFIISILENRLNNTITSMHLDEVHTLVMARGDLHTGRVGESTRWMARILSPLGKYYMTTKMGGEHYVTGWRYSGGYYLDAHFKSTAISHDPILQDYVHGMTLLLGVLAVLSFALVGFFLASKISLVSGIAYLSLPFSSAIVWEQLEYFYTETTLLIAFNIIVATFFLETNKLRLYLWLSFLMVFSISTKLTGVIFIIPILYTLYKKDKTRWESIKIEGLLFFSLIIFYLWNIPSGGLNDWIDYMVANVYHLKTGHLYTDTSNQIPRIISFLSPWLYIYALSVIINLLSPVKNKTYWNIIAVLPIIMIISMVDTAFFLYRNYTTPLVIMFLSISVSLGVVYENWPRLRSFKYLLFLPIFPLLYTGITMYESISDKVFIESSKTCVKPAIINMNTALYPKAVPLAAMPEIFNLKEQKAAMLQPFLDGTYDCVFVNGAGSNKHYTHYLLPEVYRLEERYGGYFAFRK